MAIEDGVVLAAVLSHSGPADTASRLHLYEDFRQGRTRRISEISRKEGAIYRSEALLPQQQAHAIAELISGNWLPDYDAVVVGAYALAEPRLLAAIFVRGGVGHSWLQDGVFGGLST